MNKKKNPTNLKNLSLPNFECRHWEYNPQTSYCRASRLLEGLHYHSEQAKYQLSSLLTGTMVAPKFLLLVLALARPSFRQLPWGSWFGVSSIVQRNEGLYLTIRLRLHYLGTKANFPTYHYWYEDYLNPAYYHSKLRQGMKLNAFTRSDCVDRFDRFNRTGGRRLSFARWAKTIA